MWLSKKTFVERAMVILMILTAISLGGMQATAQTAPKDSSGVPGDLSFRNIGPAVAGGRATAVHGVPGNSQVMYLGAAGGGIFKTTDGGSSWKAIFEDQPTSSIGEITLAPSNPSQVWVGTGEANIRTDISTGKGVFFSPDAGKSWKFKGLRNVGQIGKIEVDPTDPNRVFVAAIGHAWGHNKERGLYRTENGGKTWKKVLSISDSTGVVDVEMQPGNPQVMLAAAWQITRRPWNLENGGPESAIYKSTDGGDTWEKQKDGLPKGDIGRIELATSKSNPDHVYALIESNRGMLWTSQDGGDQWQLINKSHRLDVRPFYFSTMVVDPTDDDHVYFDSFYISESTDGGKSVEVISKQTHPDHHDMWIDPKDPDRIMDANDGGLITSDNGGKDWRFRDQLPIEQFYQIAVDSMKPYNMGGGLQDNSAWYGPAHTLNGGSLDGSAWFALVGGDGEYVVPAPSNPNIVYAESQNGFAQRINMKTGMSNFIKPYLAGVSDMKPSDLEYRFNWTTPIAVSYDNANTLYMGANVLFKSNDGGENWSTVSPDLTRNEKDKQITSGGPVQKDISGAETYNTIISIGLSPQDSSVIWVGSDDGLVHVTRDGGQNWTDVSGNIPDMPAYGGRIYQLDVSTFDPGTCYIAVDFHMLDNNKPYVYRTRDYGKHWEKISQGLPNEDPVHVVREDPNRKGFLVAGTETGLYYSHNYGDSWKPLEGNFPTAPVWDLKFQKHYHDLVVATHGRGVFVMDNIRPLEQLTDQTQKEKSHLFSTAPVYLYHQRSKGGLNDINKYTAPNPPEGAMIDYYLNEKIEPDKAQKKAGETGVKVEVKDQQGKTVNTLYAPGNKGINRFTWNLRYPGGTDLERGESQQNKDKSANDTSGPKIIPGQYNITLAAAGNSQTKSLTVKPDPRPEISYDMEEARRQQQATFRIQHNMSALNRMLNRIGNLENQIASFKKAADAAVGPDKDPADVYENVWDKMGKLDSTLTKMDSTLYVSGAQDEVVQDGIHYLSRFHDRYQSLVYFTAYVYNKAPGARVQQQMQKMNRQLQEYLDQFNRFLNEDVAQFNELASSENLPVLVAGSNIEIPSGSNKMP